MNQEYNKLEKTLVSFITIGFYLVFLLPLVVFHDFYYPYVTFKSFTFRLIVEVQFLLWTILVVKNKKYLPRLSLPLLSVIFLTIIMIFANLQGTDPDKNFWGNLERMDGMVNLLHLLFYFIVAVSVLRTKKHWCYLAGFSLLVATILGAIGYRELLLDPHHLITSTLGNSAYFAIYLLFHLFLAAIFYAQTCKKSKKLSYLCLFLIIYFLLLLYNTGSRGTFLGLGVSAFWVLLIVDWREKKKHFTKIIMPWSLLGLVLFGVGLWSFKETSFVKNTRTLSRLVNVASTSAVRFRFWNIAYEGIKERPLLGWGQESFDTLFERYYDPGLGDDESWYDRPHNTLLEWTVAGGVLAGLAYLCIFVSAFFWLWRRSDKNYEEEISFEVKALLSGLLIAYFIHNLFMFDYLSSYFLFFSLLAFISRKNYVMEKEYSKAQVALSYMLAFGIIIYVSYNFFMINLPGLRNARDINTALKLNQSGENSAAFEKIKEVVESKKFGSKEALEQLGQIAIAVHYDQSINNKLRDEYLGYALTKLAVAASERPQTLRKSYVYLSLAAQRDDVDLEIIFRKVLNISPKRQAVNLVMINYYLRKNEFSKALDLARKNYELDKKIHTSQTIYALCALLNKNIELSDKLLTLVPLKYYVETNKFLHAYLDLGRMDKVVEFYKKRIEYAPLDPNNYTKLGLLYKELGKKEEALREFEQAQKIIQENF